MKHDALPIAIVTGLLLVILASIGSFATWNYRITDALYSNQTPLDNIAIIGIDDQSLQELGRWPWPRTTFIPLLNATRNARVAAFDIAFFEPTAQDDDLAQAMRDHGNAIIAEEYDFKRETWLSPAPAFAGISTGVVNTYTDADGVTRRVPVTIDHLDGKRGFAAAIYHSFLNREPERETILVNYAGPPGTYATYSASDVIRGAISPDQFANALVLIGAAAPNLHDDYIVPTSDGQRMPGVEVHAHALQTLITKQHLTRQDFASLAVVIILLSMLVGIIVNKFRFRIAAVLLFATWLAYTIAAIFIFNLGLILNLVYPGLTIVACSLTSITYVASTERKDRQRILGIFGRYVSKDIVNHLLEREEAVELGGEEREITALFADIRGFTAMSEKMTPQEVITVLNHYFGDMTDLVFKHKGTLDKFIGDCLFAIWGSPLPDEKHTIHAIKCALDIQKTLAKKEHQGIPPIQLGIGICSGPAVVGNMGSSQRQEFTAIGDTVNTASRMAGQAKGGMIVIPKSTYDLVKGKVRAKKLKPVHVKGKEKPIQIYNVTGLK